MPRHARPLTALQVARAKPGTYSDGGGLLLVVGPTSASWILRYKTSVGRRRDMGLGPARGPDAIPLAEARARAEQERALLRSGQDPLEVREAREREAAAEAARAAPKRRSFREAAEATLDARKAAFRGPRYAAQWMSSLQDYVFPLIGDRPVAEVTSDDVVTVLKPLWQRVPETGSRVRQRMEQVFSQALGRGWRPKEAGNPAAWRDNLSLLMPSPRIMKRRKREREGRNEHLPALHHSEVPAFMAALRGRQGMAPLALQFLVLTVARSGMVRGMVWSEADLRRGVWTIPASRMKSAQAHQIPLSAEAVAILETVRPLAVQADGRLRRDAYVFPGARGGRPLSDMTLSMLIRRMALDDLEEGAEPRWRDDHGDVVVPHGFRTSFKEWARRGPWSDELSELALAHGDGSEVRAAYARDALLEEREPLMEAWAQYCTGAAAQQQREEWARESLRTLVQAGVEVPAAGEEASAVRPDAAAKAKRSAQRHSTS